MRILLILLALLGGFVLPARCQTLPNDSWINYNNRYLKIPVAKDGVYRILPAALTTAGVPAGTPASAFRLFVKGTEVPLRTTTAGILGIADYLEFAGFANNGSADAGLYAAGGAAQTNPNTSLFSDTVSYFLTWEAAPVSVQRFQNATVAAPAGAPAETKCRVVSTQSFRNDFAQGKSNAIGYRFPSSLFEEGEGFVHALASPGSSFTVLLPTPGALPGAGTTTLTTGVTGYALEYGVNGNNLVSAPLHPIKIYAGGSLVVDTTYGAQQYCRFTRTVPGGATTGSTPVVFQSANLSAPNFDQWGVTFAQLEYWRNTDFSGVPAARFKVAPAPVARLLSLGGFSLAGGAPVLYDLTHKKYYEVQAGGTNAPQFYIDAEADETEFFVTSAATVLPAGITQNIQFKDYSLPLNSGDYVIISHPGLNSNGDVEAYENYRASAAGGGYQTVLAYMPDLYDQFGWGIPQHPMAVRSFLSRLQTSGAVKPRQVFLLGHGVAYPSLRPGASPLLSGALVPTYGAPGSDVLLLPGAGMAVGRLPALTPLEVSTYLAKVKGFDAGIVPATVPTAASELWKKKVMHIAGASVPTLQTELLYTLNASAPVISDSAFGGSVFTIAKNTTNPVDPFSNAFVDSAIDAGSGIITFHGHAYSNGFDYNINDPEKYINSPRLPLFFALGCNVGHVFDSANGQTNFNNRTISERYIITPKGGAVAMVASNLTGFTNFHSAYLPEAYQQISLENYGATMGVQVQQTNETLTQRLKNSGDFGFYRAHLESMLFLGDPALRLFSPLKPDFHVGAASLTTSPSPVTLASDSFRLKIVAYNLGRLFEDTGLVVRVSHLSADGSRRLVGEYAIPAIHTSDTAFVTVPVNRTRDLGLNKYIVAIDPNNRFPETSEINNEATLELFISGNNLVPVYPPDFGIAYRPEVILKASTLNPFGPQATYRMELDTTELFNSPLLQYKETSGPGGVIPWQPTLAFQDSTVYYWRTAYKPLAGGPYDWKSASFIYLPGAGPGWNQSHAFQYNYNTLNGINYAAANRQFLFNRNALRINALVKVMNSGATVDSNKIQVNEVDFNRSSCNQYVTALQIMVIDPNTGAIRKNSPAEAAQVGCAAPCGANRGTWVYEFSTNDSASRNRASLFLKSIPTGALVLVKNSIFRPLYNPVSNASIWKSDTARYGAGQSLYHTLYNMGFTTLDSFKRLQSFLFWSQVGGGVPVYQSVVDDTTLIQKEFTVLPYAQSGNMQSATIGPALEWKTLLWETRSIDVGAPLNDHDTVTVWGLPAGGGPEVEVLRTASATTALAGISAADYPKLRLSWKAEDSVTRTAGQLRYWRVLHTPVPELALNPAAHYVFKTDSVETGQQLRFEVALENISDAPMREVLTKYRVSTANGSLVLLDTVRQRALPAGDTLHTAISFSSVPFTGANFLFVEANPDADQPERYHPNNLGYIPFHVQGDVYNPLLDVTFNDIHIRDRAIVAPRPAIKIRFSDDSRFRALDDTGLIDLYLRAPEDPLTLARGTKVAFDGTTCRFVPARLDSAGGVKNEAYILFQPLLTTTSNSEEEELYELLVQGRDRSGNKTGSLEYRVSFRTVAGRGITNVYNFPNPFSTTTQFAFLLTGEGVPEQFTIQVVDLQGKLVRIFSKKELGPLVVGHNKTEYRWDGRDQQGAPLPAGIYLYRAVLGGANSDLPHLNSEVDGGFKNGWGKMVIIR